MTEGAGAQALSRVRVIDLETAGDGPHDVCEIGWQDVVRSPGGDWRLGAEGGARFVNPGRAISADTMAIHHILDAQVADAPFWKLVAPEVLRPSGGVLALAAHRAAFEQRYCRPALTGGADWICTWKCALRVWPELPRFSNQMLRYQRMPAGLEHERGLAAHRAGPDAYVTAHHLRDLLNATSLEKLIAWSRQPGLLPRVPAGPFRGKAWRNVSKGAPAGARARPRRRCALQRRRRAAGTGRGCARLADGAGPAPPRVSTDRKGLAQSAPPA